MSRPRRKALAAAPAPSAAIAPRDPLAAVAPQRRYPSLAEIASSDLAAAVRGFARIAAYVGIVGAAATAAGCEPAVCGTSRFDELRAHGPESVSLLVAWYPQDAAKTLGVGLGLVPHPAPSAIAGEAPFVTPILPSGSSTPAP